ncbi:MAG: hypothetical protein Q7U41_03080, partial [Microbacterium sp.]|nr:hypothetical protein [Microbacterium sp.]
AADGEPRAFGWRGWEYEVIGVPERLAPPALRFSRWRVRASCDGSSLVTATLLHIPPEPDCAGGGGPDDPGGWVIQAIDEGRALRTL